MRVGVRVLAVSAAGLMALAACGTSDSGQAATTVAAAPTSMAPPARDVACLQGTWRGDQAGIQEFVDQLGEAVPTLAQPGSAWVLVIAGNSIDYTSTIPLVQVLSDASMHTTVAQHFQGTFITSGSTFSATFTSQEVEPSSWTMTVADGTLPMPGQPPYELAPLPLSGAEYTCSATTLSFDDGERSVSFQRG
ncbi:MAG: hypothetical protein Q7V88_01490 [Actinomycetota bacterium]|nr:hypothetical protein [Actinomycetota bacterium]